MKKLNARKGFTLIELLVVIAIIGILASIVLASLSTATSKGNDAKVQEQLSSIRDAAQIYYASNTNYGNTNCNVNITAAGSQSPTSCTAMWADTSSGMAPLMTYSDYPSGTTIDAASSATAYSVAASLSGGKFWCVDSTGASRGANAAGTVYVALTGTLTTDAHDTATGSTVCQ